MNLTLTLYHVWYNNGAEMQYNKNELLATYSTRTDAEVHVALNPSKEVDEDDYDYEDLKGNFITEAQLLISI